MSLGKKRQHWLDADDNEVYASELRTAAAIYIAALEAALAAETQRADEAEAKVEKCKGANRRLSDAHVGAVERAEQAEARVEQLEREVNEEWVTRGMPSWRSRAKRAEAAFAECKRRRECDRERIAEAEATIERLEWMLVEVDHGASIDDAASRWTPEKAAE